MPVLEILKEAILSERRAAAFYETAAKNSRDAGVGEIFAMMAEEEKSHARLLARQFVAYNKDGSFAVLADEPAPPPVDDGIVTHAVRNGILAAGFEAAAIDAAMALENRAIRLYSERAATAQDENEKKIYAWLATWERGHLQLLARLDEGLRESVWQDNSFWPLD